MVHEKIEKFVAWDSMRREKKRLLARKKREIRSGVPREAVEHLDVRIKAIESAMEKV